MILNDDTHDTIQGVSSGEEKFWELILGCQYVNAILHTLSSEEGHIQTKHEPHEVMFAVLPRHLNSTESAQEFTSLLRVFRIYSAFYRPDIPTCAEGAERIVM